MLHKRGVFILITQRLFQYCVIFVRKCNLFWFIVFKFDLEMSFCQSDLYSIHKLSNPDCNGNPLLINKDCNGKQE